MCERSCMISQVLWELNLQPCGYWLIVNSCSVTHIHISHVTHRCQHRNTDLCLNGSCSEPCRTSAGPRVRPADGSGTAECVELPTRVLQRKHEHVSFAHLFGFPELLLLNDWIWKHFWTSERTRALESKPGVSVVL